MDSTLGDGRLGIIWSSNSACQYMRVSAHELLHTDKDIHMCMCVCKRTYMTSSSAFVRVSVRPSVCGSFNCMMSPCSQLEISAIHVWVWISVCLPVDWLQTEAAAVGVGFGASAATEQQSSRATGQLLNCDFSTNRLTLLSMQLHNYIDYHHQQCCPLSLSPSLPFSVSLCPGPLWSMLNCF